MSFSVSPRIVKGGVIILTPPSYRVTNTIPMQINPDSIKRSLQVKSRPPDGDRSEAMRLSGPPVETIELTAELDATDGLEQPSQNPVVASYGIHPQIAALETLVYPSTAQLQQNNQLSQTGTLEIVPMEAPLTVFSWGGNRVMPVRITALSVQEEAFDTALNPILAKVSLSLRVLSIDDVDFQSRAGALYLSYQSQKESMAAKIASSSLDALDLRPGAV